MQQYLRYCPICGKENIRKEGHSKIYVPGCDNTYNCEPKEDTYCIYHKEQKQIKLLITCEEFQILRYISNEPSFIIAMNDLKEKDIIEYNLKLSQFKTQIQQQKSDKIQSDNRPKCPTCGSTNIEKISATKKAFGGVMFGIFSSDVRNTMHCKSCGAKW